MTKKIKTDKQNVTATKDGEGEGAGGRMGEGRGSKQVSWCFTPTLPSRLYQGQEGRGEETEED